MRRYLIIALVGCTAGGDIPAPTISTLSPDHAEPGVYVMLIGDYFCQNPPTGGEIDPLACENTGSVAFGSTPATVGMYTEQTITAEVPGLAAAKYGVTITVAGRRSNSIDFVVDAP